MDLSLGGKVAIVTGGSRGIGAQIVFELASRGANVVITYTSDSSTAEVATLEERIDSLKNGASTIAVKVDLRQKDAPAYILEKAVATFGDKIDILVNNAGCQFFVPVKDLTAEAFSQVYDLNVRAALLMSKEVLPYLRVSGRIINISSIGSRIPYDGLSLYCSSKAALDGLTRSFALELGRQGHTVNSVNAGPVLTALLDGIPSEAIEGLKQLTPLGDRLGTTDDIAQIVAFLAEERSRWVTGQTISVSGGYTMW